MLTCARAKLAWLQGASKTCWVESRIHRVWVLEKD
jgi:hypothetical protein